MKLFNKYFPKFTAYKSHIIDSFHNNKMSTWIDFSNEKYIVCDDPNNTIMPGDIIEHWMVIPIENRNEYNAFLKDIIRLSKKHKVEIADMTNSLSDSIYVMF